MIRSILAAATFLSVGLIAAPAHAQFVGDVYFLQPSIAVPAGSTGDLDLAIFTGDKPFGATTVTLTFDPAKLSIDAITDGTNGDDSVELESLVENGTVRLVAINTASLQQPFGSVAIARLRVRPTGSVNERTIVRSAVSRALYADRTVIRPGTGFDAEITVGRAGATTSTQSASAASRSALADRALRLRPPGGEVSLVVQLSSGGLGQVRVRTEGNATTGD